MRNKGAPLLLENLIAPNREVAPQYLLWEAKLADGTTIAGVIARESSDTIDFRFADGSARSVSRSEIVKLVNSNRSMMPEGLEAGLSLQAMADLLSYVSGEGR